MTTIPLHGRPSDELLAELAERKNGDTRWREGRVFSLVYAIPGESGQAHAELLAKAHAMYAATNLLNPMAFSSLKQMETEIVEMAGQLMSCPGAVGAVTSGGTESILVACATYRDRARRTRPWILRPELLVPSTIHPAFDKAAHYFGIRLVKVPVGPDLRADAVAMGKRITRNTIAIVASAPQYPHGVVDPIVELADLARRHKVPMHVDACVGGFMLPWLEKLGRPVPAWDFRVPGVTSISADLHKFGYAAKGASVLLWRSLEDMAHQIFVATDFPGGIYASPTMIGTRPGGPIAAAWTALRSLGENGYLELARMTLGAVDQLRRGIEQIPGLTLLSRSDSTIVTYTTTEIAESLGDSKLTRMRGAVETLLGKTSGDAVIYAIADRMEARGWTIDRQHRPASIHLTVNANHAPVVADYLADLVEAVAEVRANPQLAKSGSAPMYGMAGTMPVRFLVGSQVRKVFTKMYGARATDRSTP